MISLDAESRPKASRQPRSIDMGNVQITTPGRLKKKILITEDRDAPYSVMYCAMRNSVPEPMKTAENAQIPNRKVIKTSRKI